MVLSVVRNITVTRVTFKLVVQDMHTPNDTGPDALYPRLEEAGCTCAINPNHQGRGGCVQHAGKHHVCVWMYGCTW